MFGCGVEWVKKIIHSETSGFQKCAVAFGLPLFHRVCGRCMQSARAVDVRGTAVTRELRQLYEADQNEPYPSNVPSDPKEREAFFVRLWTARLKPRYDRVLQLIRDDRLQSAEDYYVAAMIINHGMKPEDNLLAHTLFVIAALKHHPDAKWASAAGLDNYLAATGRPQRFGTVYGEHRRLMTDLMTDSLRHQFCVPALNEQQRLAGSSKERGRRSLRSRENTVQVAIDGRRLCSKRNSCGRPSD